jgi:RimJ/RimL family protein N-acetyltransferase
MLAAASGSHGAGPVPVIETDRLILRAHKVEDYADCMLMWSDQKVVRHLGGRPFTAEEGWRKLLQFAGLWSFLGYGYWAVEEKSSGHFIGHVGYADFRRDLAPSLDGMLELGWVLAADAHGKGYASEAVAAACQWGQTNGGDRRIVCIIAPENQPSLRVAEKAGFKLWQHSTYHDAPILVLTR